MGNQLCGKIIYATKAIARERGAGLRERAGEMARPYWCDACAGWHLTRKQIRLYKGVRDRVPQTGKCCTSCGISMGGKAIEKVDECMFCKAKKEKVE